MCEPTTIASIASYFGASASTAATVGTVATAAAYGVAAYAAYSQVSANKKVAQANADAGRRQAADALNRGEKARMDAIRRGQVTQGQARAQLAARGLDMAEGTPSDLLAQTDFFAEQDAATARTNARKEAYNAQSRSNTYQMEADAASPGLSLTGSLLGGTAKVADRWYQYSRG